MSRKSKINLKADVLQLNEGLHVSFMRTLRIPDDKRSYPLPPGLGRFPLRRVDDHKGRVPREWIKQGGVFLPMYQREAMWIHFDAPGCPHAVKVGMGKVCAITGKRWTEKLQRRPQDYIVVPEQPWLDGIVVKKGMIRQFVAMPLGLGYSVEGQVTGKERFGGVQILAFGPRPWRAGSLQRPPLSMSISRKRRSGDMGLGAGGRMKQKVYADPHRLSAWDQKRSTRVFIHIVNSELWEEITGERPPTTPVTARSYARAGLPWCDLYDECEAAVKPSRKLKKVKSIKEIDSKKSSYPLQDDEPVQAGPVHSFWHKLRGKSERVRDGKW